MYAFIKKPAKRPRNSERKEHLIRDASGQVYQVILQNKDLSQLVKYKALLQDPEIKICAYKTSVKSSGEEIGTILKMIDTIKSELEHLRIAALRNKGRKAALTKIRQMLAEKNIHSAMDLISYGTEKFENNIGRGDIGTILGKTLYGCVHVQDLRDLSTHLRRDLKEEIKADLKNKAGIYNQKTLRKYTQHKFVDTFGLKRVGVINGRYSRANQRDLIEFGENLGWSFKEELKEMLRERDIKGGLDLLRYQSKKLDDIKSYLGMFLNRYINAMNVSYKYELCEKLHWDITKEIGREIKNYLQKTHKGAIMDAIDNLHLKIHTSAIIEKYLPQINKYLGYNIIDNMIWQTQDELEKKYHVHDAKSYQKVRAKQLRKLGLQRIGLIVGYSVYDVNKSVKHDFGKKLGYV